MGTRLRGDADCSPPDTSEEVGVVLGGVVEGEVRMILGGGVGSKRVGVVLGGGVTGEEVGVVLRGVVAGEDVGVVISGGVAGGGRGTMPRKSQMKMASPQLMTRRPSEENETSLMAPECPMNTWRARQARGSL